MRVPITEINLSFAAQPKRCIRRGPCLSREGQLDVAANGVLGWYLGRYFGKDLVNILIPPEHPDKNSSCLGSLFGMRAFTYLVKHLARDKHRHLIGVYRSVWRCMFQIAMKRMLTR